jgi:hypothetical protein
MRRAVMNEPVASLHLPCAGETQAQKENGLARLTSRDVWENSNARFVQAPIDSGFVAAIAPVANEIFYPDSSL